ncbi:MAG: SUMF1/EgtB/PvdO family nonheme iron enzyme [Rhodothermia bacterium]|nr:SUMF1/EgtB/PvdO family nonheme iron enzyme [Rhodothermia bacterium]
MYNANLRILRLKVLIKLINKAFYILFFSVYVTVSAQESRKFVERAPIVKPTGANKRLALLMGNEQYRYLPKLSKPEEDVLLMEQTLRNLGFTVIKAVNQTRSGMQNAVDQFMGKVKGDEEAVVFYFAGHGFQYGTGNWLAGIEAATDRPDRMAEGSLSIEDIQRKLAEKAKDITKILILDACRVLPALRVAGWQSGLNVGLDQVVNAKIIYGTRPNGTAREYEDAQNGVFTEALAGAILEEGVGVDEICRKVSVKVSSITERGQIPDCSGILFSDFYFKPKAKEKIDLNTPKEPLVKPKTQVSFIDPKPSINITINNKKNVKNPKKENIYPKYIKNNYGIEFVLIDKGVFMRGSLEDEKSDSSPRKEIIITNDFYVGKYEVTQEQWLMVMGDNPSKNKSNLSNPVENISWYEVQEFIKRLNAKENIHSYRLPTEAEWEYIARAGSVDRFPWGEFIGTGRANCADCTTSISGVGSSMSVGNYPPNNWEIFDVIGNVWEWTMDWYDGKYYQNAPNIDPVNNVQTGYPLKVIRGGSFIHEAKGLEHRYFFDPNKKNANIGFRLVKVLD